MITILSCVLGVRRWEKTSMCQNQQQKAAFTLQAEMFWSRAALLHRCHQLHPETQFPIFLHCCWLFARSALLYRNLTGRHCRLPGNVSLRRLWERGHFCKTSERHEEKDKWFTTTRTGRIRGVQFHLSILIFKHKWVTQRKERDTHQ